MPCHFGRGVDFANKYACASPADPTSQRAARLFAYYAFNCKVRTTHLGTTDKACSKRQVIAHARGWAPALGENVLGASTTKADTDRVFACDLPRRFCVLCGRV